ncbi:Hypothetical protein PHPALM_36747 [Phytophthora palmivora]|uniref:Uncharacterized protein n=1 Tax=Phytophthora palmivora TaxID=4796 RepID=A0A2P4WZ84_9STRA|nr:Hypothetical protein PHPALM_36747 [Phytophthora palmivora]
MQTIAKQDTAPFFGYFTQVPHDHNRVLPDNLLDVDGNFDREKSPCSFMKHMRLLCSEYDSRPRALSSKTLSPYGSYKNALVHLSLKVFDSTKLDDVAKWERFMTFYSSILIPLFTVQDVFFLVAGHASFLSYVGIRTMREPKTSYCHFIIRWLSLDLLKPSYCELDNNQLAEVAEHLFTTVRGHPRVLLEKFCGCHTYDDLVADASNAGVEGKCPRNEFPSFFNEQQKFGLYTTENNAEITCWTPKVMEREKESRSVVTAAADPDKMYVLMNEMTYLFRDSTSPPTLEPPNILLMAMAQDTKRSEVMAVKYGLAAKKAINSECERFNNLHRVFEKRQNILIMCLRHTLLS